MMSDDLKERLRANHLDECYEAIERIEELEAKLRQEIKDKERVERVWGDNYAALEAKLAKALEGITRAKDLFQVTHTPAALDALLAELKGPDNE